MHEKSDKAAFFIKTAIRVVLGALIVMVFIRNAFPDVKQAVVLEDAGVSSGYGSSEITDSSTENASSGSSVPDRFVPVEPNENPESSAVSLPDKNEVFEASSAPEKQITAKININTAPAGELVKLNGIGETKAAAIVKYRSENGGFKSIEEIVNVSGIGEKTLENIRDFITV
ncbi:MAG: helix-hairpin-helix domain-containing protein [Oscillospiraceae bacterium]|nr:helix-hairpin-helix domain-containing protein [Oscillospiraceae bacterium]